MMSKVWFITGCSLGLGARLVLSAAGWAMPDCPSSRLPNLDWLDLVKHWQRAGPDTKTAGFNTGNFNANGSSRTSPTLVIRK